MTQIIKSKHESKAEIIKAWEKAYDKWEAGESASPSAYDLAIIARDIDPLLPCDERVSDAIYESANEGHDLADTYDKAYGN